MTERKFSSHAFLDVGSFEYRDDQGHFWLEPGLKESDPDELLDRIFKPDRQVWIRSTEADTIVRAIFARPSHCYDIEMLQKGELYRITVPRISSRMTVVASRMLSQWEVDHDKNGQPVPSNALETAFSRYQETFKIKFGYSKGQQGLYLLERFRQQAGGQGDLALQVPSEGFEPFKPNIGDLYFSRKLTRLERQKPFLVAVDKNQAYATAASIKLGLVRYTHYVKPPWEFRAGIYRVKISGKDSPLLPPIAPSMGGRPDWFDAPTLRLLSNYQIPFEIEEGYIWNQESAVLDHWAKTLRLAAMAQGDLIEDWILRRLIKQTANAAIGKLGRPDSILYRPDWRNSIIREHAARIQRDLLSIVDKGIFPLAIYSDCIYFACDMGELMTHPFLMDERLYAKYKLAGVYDISSPAAKKLFNPERKNLPYELKQYRSEVFSGADYVFV
jgi:hypothetical protein